MGQKIHPKAFRLQTIYGWDSKWFARGKKFISYLEQDVQLRSFLKKELKNAGVAEVTIDRNANKINVTITASKPGFIIGRGGAGIEELKKKIMKMFYRGQRVNINLNIKEIKQPSLSSPVVGQQIATEIEKRMPFRRSMKMAAERVMKAGAKGVKISVGGRLNGADIARTETVTQGSIPLHNLRADIDYSHTCSNTIYGVIGVKVWIYRGEIFDGDSKKQA